MSYEAYSPGWPLPSRQWGAAVYMMCDVPPGSLGVQPVDGAFPTGAPMALLSPTNYLTFGGTGSGMRQYSCLCPGLFQSLLAIFLIR